MDFLARMCAAWDFGIIPRQETIDEISCPVWREAADRSRLLISPAYHMVRQWHDLPRLPYLGQEPPHIHDYPE